MLKDKDQYVSTFNLLARHKVYLEGMRKAEGQNKSDTIRRALDEYMAKHPLPEVKDGSSN